MLKIFPTDKSVSFRTAYEGDSGTDIGCPVRTPVFCVSDATVIYAEWGHTPWTEPPDTPYSIKLRLDNPIKRNGQSYPYVFYTHLSSVETLSKGQKIKAGRLIAYTGVGNNVPHLHISFSEDTAVTKYIDSLDGQDMMWDEWPQVSIQEDEDMLSFVEPNVKEEGVRKYSGLWTGTHHPGLEDYRGDVWLDLNVLKDQKKTTINYHIIKPDGKKLSHKVELRDGQSAGRLINAYTNDNEFEGACRLVVTTPNDEPFDATVKQFFVK